MIMIDYDTYYTIKSNDLVDLRCDNCSKIYQITKKDWYYNAYNRRNKLLNFQSKTYCSKICLKSNYNKANITNNCLECNKSFISKIHQNKKFCGLSCAAIFNNRKRGGNKLVNCYDCNIEFSIWNCIDRKIYKCDRCKKIKNSIKKIPIIKEKTKKKCLVCSKEIERNSFYFCSENCKNENSIYKCIYPQKMYEHTCKGCNIVFYKLEKDSKYCSNSCKSKNLKLASYAHRAGGRSRSQIELFIESKLVKDFPNINFLFNDKDAIGSELDVYIPDLKLAIEINGIVHYEPIYGEEKLIKVQNNDKQKMINCYNNGIELIVIPLGRKGLSNSQKEEIYKEIYSIIEKIKNRICLSS